MSRERDSCRPGERAGNAPLEEVAVAVEVLYGYQSGIDLRRLSEVAEIVARAAGRAIPEAKAIVGGAVFTHESGIHVDGLLKDRQCYQALDPAVLGRSHRMVLGKHSGLGAVRNALKELGFDASPDEAKVVLTEIRAYAQQTKAGVSRDMLMSFYQAVNGGRSRSARLLSPDVTALPH